jgi:hypothetical protein
MIHEIENFIDPDLVRQLATHLVWDEHPPDTRFQHGRKMFSALLLGSEMSEIRRKIEQRLNTVYSIDPYAVAAQPLKLDATYAVDMGPGDSQEAHADNSKSVLVAGDIAYNDARPSGVEPNHTPWRDYSALLYLNTTDEAAAGNDPSAIRSFDFGGGTFRFVQKKRWVFPRAGTLLLFPCSWEYEHEVQPITWGRRRNIAMWATRDPSHWEHWPEEAHA